MIILDNIEFNMFDVCSHIEKHFKSLRWTHFYKMLTSKIEKKNVQISNMARKVKFDVE